MNLRRAFLEYDKDLYVYRGKKLIGFYNNHNGFPSGLAALVKMNCFQYAVQLILMWMIRRFKIL